MEAASYSDEDQARHAELLRAQHEVEGLASFIDRVNPRYPVVPHLAPLINLIERTRHEQVLACVSMPPRHRKSTTLLNGLAWRMMLDPGVSHAFVTFNDTKTKRESRLCRRIAASAGVPLDPTRRSLNLWGTTHGGLFRATSIEGGFTGEGVNGVVVIDDPIKDRQEANSPARLEFIWEWFTDVAMLRLEPGSSVVIVMCMTGDTPVLMGDGTERPLRDVRPGHTVATLDGGTLTTSTVRNWANQGPDSVYRIRLKSGRAVRANARHPFLVIKNGGQVWTRTDQLAPGSVIQAVTGGSGAGRLEPDEVVDVTPCGVEDVYDVQIDRTENFIANGLVSHNTRWADNDLIGRVLKGEHNEMLRQMGAKEVHFEEINLPAICENPASDILGRKKGQVLWPEQYGHDYFNLRRALNPWSFEALYQQSPKPKEGRLFDEPARFDLEHFLSKGFDGFRLGIGVDPAASGKRRADHWAAVLLAVEGWRENMIGYVIEVLRFRADPIEGAKRIAEFQQQWGDLELVIEGGTVGKSPIASLRRQYPHLRIVEMPTDVDKWTRAQPAAGAWNKHRLKVPLKAPWVGPFIGEAKNFTGVDGREDDQVDGLAHIWNAMVDVPEPIWSSGRGNHLPVP